MFSLNGPGLEGFGLPRIALWAFNEASGSSVANDTEVSDGTAQNGSFENGATTDGSGLGVFDGIDDYIEVPTDPGFDLDTGSVVITFTQDTASQADQPFGSPAAQTLFSRDSTGFGNGGHLSIFIRSDGSVAVRHQTIDENFVYAGGTVTLGQPTTIVYSWSPTGSQLSVDGVVVDSGTDALVLTGDPEPVTIGASQAVSTLGTADNPVGFFDGTIDAVALYDETVPPSTVPCLTAGTLIQTSKGPVPVEALCVGDLVRTKDNGMQPIRWIGSRSIPLPIGVADPTNLHPVRIQAGAMGHGLPTRDILVSRQHRMLVSSKIVERMFGSESVLIPAIKLTILPNIHLETEVAEVTYFHLLFDQHEVIYAEDAPTESLLIGTEAMAALPFHARREIKLIFPELELDAEVPEPSGKLQKRLLNRHMKNEKALLETYQG